MIVTRLLSGLGNQLFQYAAGRRLALRHRTTLALDLTWFDDKESFVRVRRQYELGAFAIAAQPTTDPPEPDVPHWRWWPPGRVTYRVIRERADFALCEEALDAPDDTILAGYWQSERYFRDVEQQLRCDLVFVHAPSAAAAAVLNEIRSAPSVSIHVRRGDYVTVSPEFHGVLPMAYYEAAIDEMSRRVPAARFFVFSDEPEWCRAHFHPRRARDMQVVDLHGVDDGVEDLRLLAACDHHIIANSSFSWWGAWLGVHPSKHVIGPAHWFLTPTIQTSRILPSGWQAL